MSVVQAAGPYRTRAAVVKLARLADVEPQPRVVFMQANTSSLSGAWELHVLWPEKRRWWWFSRPQVAEVVYGHGAAWVRRQRGYHTLFCEVSAKHAAIFAELWAAEMEKRR